MGRGGWRRRGPARRLRKLPWRRNCNRRPHAPLQREAREERGEHERLRHGRGDEVSAKDPGGVTEAWCCDRSVGPVGQAVLGSRNGPRSSTAGGPLRGACRSVPPRSTIVRALTACCRRPATRANLYSDRNTPEPRKLLRLQPTRELTSHVLLIHLRRSHTILNKRARLPARHEPPAAGDGACLPRLLPRSARARATIITWLSISTGLLDCWIVDAVRRVALARRGTVPFLNRVCAGRCCDRPRSVLGVSWVHPLDRRGRRRPAGRTVQERVAVETPASRTCRALGIGTTGASTAGLALLEAGAGR